MSIKLEPELIPEYRQAALDAAREAGLMLAARQYEAQRIPTGEEEDLLIDLDRASDRIIAHILTTRCPGIHYDSGESGHNHSGTLRWIVDPVDGNSNHFNQRPDWGVSIALYEDDVAIVAVLYLPILGSMFSLEQNGTHHNGKHFVTNQVNPSREATRFHVPWSKKSFYEGHRDLEVQSRLLEHFTYPVNQMCGIADIRAVLLGQAQGLVFRRPGIDHAAAAVPIAIAAGCIVTQLDGSPWELGTSLLCTRYSHRVQHDEIVHLLHGA